MNAYTTETADNLEGLAQLDKQSPEPLYTQLQACLKAWIGTREPGDRLPAERWLAERAGVNRGTMRKALAELVDVGLLERGPRGTVIARRKPLPPPLSPHPLMQVSHRRERLVKTVRMAVFENLPHQRRFWQDVCTALAESDVRLELDWVPETVTTPGGYAEFIDDRGCELVVFSGGMEKALRVPGLLQQLPQQLCERIGGKDLWWQHLSQIHDPLLPWGVPVHVNIPLFVWNRELLPMVQEPASWLTFEQLIEWLDRANEELAGKVPLLGSPFDVVNILGAVCHTMTEADLRRALRRLFAQLSRLFAYPAVKLSNQMDMFEAARGLLEERAATYFGASPVVFSATEPEVADLRCSLVQPTEDRYVAVHETAVGLTVLGSRNEAACDVLGALVGPRVQELVVRHRINLPIRREQADLFAARLGVGAEDLASLLRRCRFLKVEMHTWDWYVQFSISTLPQLGHLSADADDLAEDAYQEAIAIARKHFHFLED